MADENPSESQLTPLGEANARYERLVELPSISSVSFTDSHTVQLHLAYKDHANLTKHVKTGSVVLDDSGKVVTTTPLVRRDASVKDEFAVRGMKKWKVFLREEGEGKKRRFVDVWNEQSSTRMYSVEVSDVHGAFAVDGERCARGETRRSGDNTLTPNLLHKHTQTFSRPPQPSSPVTLKAASTSSTLPHSTKRPTTPSSPTRSLALRSSHPLAKSTDAHSGPPSSSCV